MRRVCVNDIPSHEKIRLCEFNEGRVPDVVCSFALVLCAFELELSEKKDEFDLVDEVGWIGIS